MTKYTHMIIAQLPGLSTKERLLLVNLFPDFPYQGPAEKKELEKIIGRLLSSAFPRGQQQFKDMIKKAEQTAKSIEALLINPVWIGEAGYPPQLREIYNPPYLLYVRGRMPSFEFPMVAIVGTRTPSAASCKAAFVLAAELSLAGLPIVSGLARGIDTGSHIGAVKVKGISAAVFGCGLDRVYPLENRKLAFQILENQGAWISEYPPGTPPLKYHFPARNRIISGLCRGVVVVQGAKDSGALITAKYALEQNRDLFVHAKGLTGASCSGIVELADQGAPVIESGADLTAAWGIHSAEKIEAYQFEENTGQPWDAGIAKRIEDELSGQVIRFDDAFFRRRSA